MGASGRNDSPSVYANVGVHAGVEITLEVDRDGGEASTIRFGPDGPDVIMDFADLDSLERLAVLAAEGVRRIRAGADDPR
ncbi:MAG TPA: hypothetical protein VFV67_22315 [Actinophytocola sp.]|uniref:hypothetical protein n=1 Tax=Actinophytocola sp. TaxID=1872138 RepID=UPI002DBC3684|nr:hypothetical protein [Actinophytocola sp.]HEU5473387.1 hypothetical protein [Actinophytocola sp.]